MELYQTARLFVRTLGTYIASIVNDLRFQLKGEINPLTDSDVVEVKSYT